MAATDTSWYNNILKANQDFDLNAPLTEEELIQTGMVTVLPSRPSPAASESTTPVLKDLDEMEDDSPVDAVADFIDGSSYNGRYQHYSKCQAIAALVAFEEGWESFEELILKPYVQERKRENKEYRGEDPNKAFSLRLKQQAAEDFVRAIRIGINEAVTTPKPALEAKK